MGPSRSSFASFEANRSQRAVPVLSVSIRCQMWEYLLSRQTQLVATDLKLNDCRCCIGQALRVFIADPRQKLCYLRSHCCTFRVVDPVPENRTPHRGLFSALAFDVLASTGKTRPGPEFSVSNRASNPVRDFSRVTKGGAEQNRSVRGFATNPRTKEYYHA